MDTATKQQQVDMTFFGYTNNNHTDTPEQLREVAISAPPATLRHLAAFLIHAADLMEQHGASFGHLHFEDSGYALGKAPSFVVAKAPDSERDSS